MNNIKQLADDIINSRTSRRLNRKIYSSISEEDYKLLSKAFNIKPIPAHVAIENRNKFDKFYKEFLQERGGANKTVNYEKV